MLDNFILSIYLKTFFQEICHYFIIYTFLAIIFLLFYVAFFFWLLGFLREKKRVRTQGLKSLKN